MISTQAKKILVIAGEASGDQFAAEVIQQYNQHRPMTKFFGMGGSQMAAAGCRLIASIDQLSVIGLWDTLIHLNRFRRLLQRLKLWIQDNQPDCIILVDYPGFNLRLAPFIHRLKIPLIYYIAPKTWASREGRLKLMRATIDHLAVIFPFEVDYFKNHGISTTFVGNPTLQRLQPLIDQQKNTLKKDSNTIALLPGSRTGEIKRHLPLLLQAALKIQAKHPNLHWMIPVAKTIDINTLQSLIQPHASQLSVKLVDDNTDAAIAECKAAIVASGTATLEVALLGIPQIIIYKTHWLTYWLAKKLITLTHIGLCNIVAQKEIALELLQHHATPQTITHELEKLLTHADYYQHRQQQTQGLRDQLQAINKSSLIHIIDQAIFPITDKYHPDYRPPGYRDADDLIELTNYNSKWPQMAATEIHCLRSKLPEDEVIDIQHIGSTAIPHATAKPLIDIQIAVQSLATIRQTAIKQLEMMGYSYWYANPNQERMLFMKGLPPTGNGRTHQVHIYEHTSHHWHDKLFFRDYLRQHSEALQQYTTLKKSLAKKHRYDRESYTDGKRDFVASILKKRPETTI